MTPITTLRSGALVSLAWLACELLACTGTARADFPLQRDWDLVNGGFPVPVDGVLLFRLQGNAPGNAVQPTFAPTVAETTGRLIAGALAAVDLETEDLYATFAPQELLLPRQTYSGASFEGRSSFTFTASDRPLVDGPPVVESSADTVVGLRLTTRACCSAGPIGDLDTTTPSCLPIRIVQEPDLHITMSPVLGRESAAGQFLYKATLTTPEIEPSPRWLAVTDGPQGWLIRSPRSVDEYCYRLEAQRLSDGQSFVLEEETCVPSTLEDLQELAPTEGEILNALNILVCSAPPEGFTDAWCTVNRRNCIEGGLGAVCDTTQFASLCADSPPSDLFLPDQVELAAAAAGLLGPDQGTALPDDSDALLDSGVQDDASTQSEARVMPSSGSKQSGCSCSALGSAQNRGSTWAAWLLLALIGYAARAWRSPRILRRLAARRSIPIVPASSARP